VLLRQAQQVRTYALPETFHAHIQRRNGLSSERAKANDESALFGDTNCVVRNELLMEKGELLLDRMAVLDADAELEAGTPHMSQWQRISGFEGLDEHRQRQLDALPNV